LLVAVADSSRGIRELRQMADDASSDEEDMGEEEEEKERQQNEHRLADAPQIEGGQEDDDPALRREPRSVPLGWDEAEDGGAGRRHGGRDGEDIVHQQGAAE